MRSAPNVTSLWWRIDRPACPPPGGASPSQQKAKTLSPVALESARRLASLESWPLARLKVALKTGTPLASSMVTELPDHSRLGGSRGTSSVHSLPSGTTSSEQRCGPAGSMERGEGECDGLDRERTERASAVALPPVSPFGSSCLETLARDCDGGATSHLLPAPCLPAAAAGPGWSRRTQGSHAEPAEAPQNRMIANRSTPKMKMGLPTSR
mmetsp:Transcript_62180/g.200472  ORF Transcript_62180/g.200472 Transcript_62180/m.200472 type:complete len:211 (-) Transcript_62180:68-700(-)